MDETVCLECGGGVGPKPGLETAWAAICTSCAAPLIAAEAAHMRAVVVLDDPSTDEAMQAAAGQVLLRHDLDVGAQLWICGTEYGSKERREAEDALKTAAMRVIREER